MTTVLRVVAPYFCAGVVLEEGVVVKAAPILGYMRGWSMSKCQNYARRKGWDYDSIDTVRERLPPNPPTPGPSPVVG